MEHGRDINAIFSGNMGRRITLIDVRIHVWLVRETDQHDAHFLI